MLQFENSMRLYARLMPRQKLIFYWPAHEQHTSSEKIASYPVCFPETPVTLPTDLDTLGRFNSEREYSPGRLRATDERLPVAPERKRNGDTFTERREEKRVGILGKNEHLAVTEAKYVERIEQRVIQRDDALGRFREGEVTMEREVLRKENVAFGERSALRTAPKETVVNEHVGGLDFSRFADVTDDDVIGRPLEADEAEQIAMACVKEAAVTAKELHRRGKPSESEVRVNRQMTLTYW
ncbi:unnamed protein product [Gongylonema pulchrum]|uniref:Uncharacterized protein n=1 Tax=Gongylonema pulchrum TaxID=637853 RepID=A0A183E3S5_9BILA|nr:unnamed protein product [Gongylonema pulchrum]